MIEGKNKTYLGKHRRDVKGTFDIRNEYAKDNGHDPDDLVIGSSIDGLRMEILDRFNIDVVLYDEEIK